MTNKKGLRLNQPLSPRTTRQILIGLGLVLALTGGLYGGYQIWSSKSKSPAQVKKQIARYLRNKSEQSDFKVDLPERLLHPEVGKERPNRSNRNRNRDWRSRRRDVAVPNLGEFSGKFRAALNEATDYKTIYKLIGEHLWAADQMLDKPSLTQKEVGVYLTLESARASAEDAYDPWLAARISEAYLWPQLDWAQTNQNSRVNADFILSAAEQSFSQADEPQSVIRSFKYYLARAQDPDRANMIRFRLARLLESEGEYKDALESLQSIQTGSNTNWQNRIASLEKRLSARLK
jgi:hypothetical protein